MIASVRSSSPAPKASGGRGPNGVQPEERMAVVNRTAQLLAASLLAFLMIFLTVPAGAHAVDPIPGPIDEILDVPSGTAKSITGSPMGDQLVVDLWRAMTQKAKTGTPVPAVPKPITAPAAFTRVGGVAAGSVLTAAMAAWAIGSNGSIALIGAATGTDYESVFCSQPSWYQGVSGFVNMGFAPDCGAYVLQPNQDKPTVIAFPSGRAVGSYDSQGSGFTTRNFCGGGASLYNTGQSLEMFFSGAGMPPSTTGNLRFEHAGCTTALGQRGAVVTSCNLTHTTDATCTNPVITGARIVTTGGTVVETATVTSPNPTRTPRCRIEWENGSVTTGTGTPYNESDGLPMSAAGLGCEEAYVSQPGRGPALIPTEIGVTSEDDAGAITEISTQPVPDMSPDQRKGLTTGNGHGLVLSKVIGTVATSCMTWEADCTNWWEQTDNGTTPGVYRCTFAGEVIALAECGAYRYTFDTQTQTPTITNPTTGEQADWSAQPNTGNSISPGTGPGTGLTPADVCFSTGWAAVANPVDWVLVPIKCALVWAFVPRPAEVEAAQNSVKEAWEDTGPGKLAGAMAGWAFIPPGGGCSGLTFSWSDVFGHNLPDWNILNACPGSPLVPAAVATNIVLTISAILGLLYALTRFFGGTVGFSGLGGGRGD